MKVFHQYLKGKKADDHQTKDTLTNVLRLFYAEARKAGSTSYSKSTWSSHRFGLNRHFKATRGFDIINDSEFTDVNKVFGAKCVDLKRPGVAKVVHKPPTCEEDLKKLCECTAFVLDGPEKLQNNFFFQVMLYFIYDLFHIYFTSFHSSREI